MYRELYTAMLELQLYYYLLILIGPMRTLEAGNYSCMGRWSENVRLKFEIVLQLIVLVMIGNLDWAPRWLSFQLWRSCLQTWLAMKHVKPLHPFPGSFVRHYDDNFLTCLREKHLLLIKVSLGVGHCQRNLSLSCCTCYLLFWFVNFFFVIFWWLSMQNIKIGFEPLNLENGSFVNSYVQFWCHRLQALIQG